MAQLGIIWGNNLWDIPIWNQPIWEQGGSLAPVFTGTIPDQSLTITFLMTPLNAGMYFTGATSYSYTGTLPIGISFDSLTGIFSGTPMQLGTFPGIVATGTNVGGTTPSNAFTITVNNIPSGGGCTVPCDHTTTATDIIQGALRFCNVYAPGESLDAADADDAMETLNDLLDSWSTDQASIFASEENILTFTPNQYRYTIGNYDAGTFAGLVQAGSPTIQNVIIPSGMVVNGDLHGTGIPDGTYIVAFDAGMGTITMSDNATVSPGMQQICFTICGDFKIPRPLRVTDSFTRINTQGAGLDYPISIISQERYIEIGYKAIQAPWPIVAWYNPTMPLGTIYFYQNPSGGGELHLFTDTILTRFTHLNQEVVMPQGYVRALKRMLARELAPEYGATWTAQMEKLAKEAYDYVKSLNQVPVPVARYDSELIQHQRTDAGWILYGGFR